MNEVRIDDYCAENKKTTAASSSSVSDNSWSINFKSSGISSHRFRFENAWLLQQECRRVVLQSWRKMEGLQFAARLTGCGQSLTHWYGELYRRSSSCIKRLKGRLKFLRGRRDSGARAEFKAGAAKLRLLLQQQEAYWKQRAKKTLAPMWR